MPSVLLHRVCCFYIRDSFSEQKAQETRANQYTYWPNRSLQSDFTDADGFLLSPHHKDSTHHLRESVPG